MKLIPLAIALAVLLPTLLPTAAAATWDADIVTVVHRGSSYSDIGDEQYVRVKIKNTGTSEPEGGYASYFVIAWILVDGETIHEFSGTLYDVKYGETVTYPAASVWDFEIEEPGTYKVKAEVYNVYANPPPYDTYTGTLFTVTNSNDPPQLTSQDPGLGSYERTVGQSFVAKVYCSDPDGDSMTVDFEDGYTSYQPVAVSGGYASKTFSFNSPTTRLITGECVDSEGQHSSSEAEWEVGWVAQQNRAPSVTNQDPAPASYSKTVGESFVAKVFCSDADGDSMTAEFEDGSTSYPAVSVSGGSASKTFTFNSPTTRSITAKCVDSKGARSSSQASWEVGWVEQQNRAPSVTNQDPAPASYSKTVGESFVAKVFCADPDGDSMTAEFEDGRVAVARYDPLPVSGGSASKTFTSNSPTTLSISAKCVDSKGAQSSSAANWEVGWVEQQNRAPTVTGQDPAPASYSKAVGESFVAKVFCADPDGDSMTAEFEDGVTTYAAVPVSSGSASKTFTLSTPATRSITVECVDSNGARSRSETGWEVGWVDRQNRAPSVTNQDPAAASYSKTVGESFAATVFCSDADGDNMTAEFRDGSTSYPAVSVSGGSASKTFMFNSPTTRSITAKCVDSKGARSSSQASWELGWITQENRPPVTDQGQLRTLGVTLSAVVPYPLIGQRNDVVLRVANHGRATIEQLVVRPATDVVWLANCDLEPDVQCERLYERARIVTRLLPDQSVDLTGWLESDDVGAISVEIRLSLGEASRTYATSVTLYAPPTVIYGDEDDAASALAFERAVNADRSREFTTVSSRVAFKTNPRVLIGHPGSNPEMDEIINWDVVGPDGYFVIRWDSGDGPILLIGARDLAKLEQASRLFAAEHAAALYGRGNFNLRSLLPFYACASRHSDSTQCVYDKLDAGVTILVAVGLVGTGAGTAAGLVLLGANVGQSLAEAEIEERERARVQVDDGAFLALLGANQKSQRKLPWAPSPEYDQIANAFRTSYDEGLDAFVENIAKAADRNSFDPAHNDASSRSMADFLGPRLRTDADNRIRHLLAHGVTLDVRSLHLVKRLIYADPLFADLEEVFWKSPERFLQSADERILDITNPNTGGLGYQILHKRVYRNGALDPTQKDEIWVLRHGTDVNGNRILIFVPIQWDGSSQQIGTAFTVRDTTSFLNGRDLRFEGAKLRFLDSGLDPNIRYKDIPPQLLERTLKNLDETRPGITPRYTALAQVLRAFAH